MNALPAPLQAALETLQDYDAAAVVKVTAAFKAGDWYRTAREIGSAGWRHRNSKRAWKQDRRALVQRKALSQLVSVLPSLSPEDQDNLIAGIHVGTNGQSKLPAAEMTVIWKAILANLVKPQVAVVDRLFWLALSNRDACDLESLARFGVNRARRGAKPAPQVREAAEQFDHMVAAAALARRMERCRPARVGATVRAGL